MTIDRIVADIESQKRAGHFDDLMFENVNLTMKMCDKSLQIDNIEDVKDRAREVLNFYFIEELKLTYPWLFEN